MSRELILKDQLIIPFGVHKYDIKHINIKAVSPYETYIESNIPFAYINKRDKHPLKILDFWSLVPKTFLNELIRIRPYHGIYYSGLYYNPDLLDDLLPHVIEEFENRHNLICNYLKCKFESHSDYERKFIDIYFNYWRELIGYSSHFAFEFISILFSVLLPLPQAHIYLEDSLKDTTHMQKVDFLFWTGARFIAVEIDGDMKEASKIVPRDRRYKKYEIEVIHILNSEIEKEQIMKILPQELTSLDFINKHSSGLPLISEFDVDCPDY